jgi:hypothetical protein
MNLTWFMVVAVHIITADVNDNSKLAGVPAAAKQHCI